MTTGEPAGIGPDLALLLSQKPYNAELIILADPALLHERAQQLNIAVTLEPADLSHPPVPVKPGTLRYLPIPLARRVKAGQLNKDNANYVVQMLEQALKGALSGGFDAIVTAPVHKGVINESGLPFTGHTEFFADGAGVDKVVMMLATSSLRVALATTHLPLCEVSQAITASALAQVIDIINHSMQVQFALEQPRIAVCGLNPHAGEGGHLGTEEMDVIAPVITRCRQRGLSVSGPWPADTVFVQDKLAQFDVILAMYHDQGLPVLKHKGFGQAVNVTLGLPFIRTSVDHGTALDLAGTGRISTGSLDAAISMAQSMIQTRQ